MNNAFSSQAGLASFTPAPGPVTIYAAVIEWPSEYADYDGPALIMERTRPAMIQGISAEMAEFADSFASGVEYAQRLKDVLAGMSHLTEEEWLSEAPFHDEMPFISVYEREV